QLLSPAGRPVALPGAAPAVAPGLQPATTGPVDANDVRAAADRPGALRGPADALAELWRDDEVPAGGHRRRAKGAAPYWGPQDPTRRGTGQRARLGLRGPGAPNLTALPSS